MKKNVRIILSQPEVAALSFIVLFLAVVIFIFGFVTGGKENLIECYRLKREKVLVERFDKGLCTRENIYYNCINKKED